MLAGYVAVAGTFAALFWLDRVARTSNDLDSVVMAAVLAITTVVGWSTFALAIFIGRMTKRVLRAIDLAVEAIGLHNSSTLPLHTEGVEETS